MGPKEAAKMSMVSKNWKSLVSDDELWIYFFFQIQQQQQQQHCFSWDSLVFAETHLRCGYPLQ